MKKKLLALGLAVMTVAMSLVGCSEKAVTWTVTCPWAPSGVAAMVSQKAASLSNTYSDKIILVADAVKGMGMRNIQSHIMLYWMKTMRNCLLMMSCKIK